MILLGLNEINFPFVERYIKSGQLPNFKKIVKNGLIKTNSEKDYYLLEPWIQWVTVFTGLSYKEHKVFRLGDIVNRKDLSQIFEKLEKKSFKVGAVSPFNVDNRLKSPAFFIPDPWTKTHASGNFLVKKISSVISKIVNNNASSKLEFLDLFWMIIFFILNVRLKKWLSFLKLIPQIKLPGVKAIILDKLLIELFFSLKKKTNPDFSHIFLNSGAHIQHHYLFNSSVYNGNLKNPEWYISKNWDPLLQILKVYDDFIGNLLDNNEKIICLTGLSQDPHDEETYYWRLKNHNSFLKNIGFKDFIVKPRMSRDFLIEFESNKLAKHYQKILESYKDSIHSNKVFNVDNRGNSLFVELIFSKNLTKDIVFKSNLENDISGLNKKLAFVAIKNGKHNGTGYLLSNLNLGLKKKIKLKDVHKLIYTNMLAHN